MEDDFPTSKEDFNTCRHIVKRYEMLSVGDSWMNVGDPLWFTGCRTYNKNVTSVPVVWDPILDPSQDDLLSELLESLDVESAAWQGLPFLGELASTVRMFRNPLSFWKGVRVPKRLRHVPLGRLLTKHLSALNIASGAWLGYQYGLKPLFSDMKVVAETAGSMSDSYNEYVNGNPIWRSAMLAGAMQESSRVIPYNNNSSRDVFIQQTQSRVTMQYRIVPASALGNVLSYPEYAAKRLGLSPAQIASTAWELVPYSFVADWFLPVGNLLSKMTKLPCNLRTRKVGTHTKYTSSKQTEQRSDYYGTYRSGVAAIDRNFRPKERWTYERYDRSPWVATGIPGATGFTTTRAITALSLIAQKLLLPIQRGG